MFPAGSSVDCRTALPLICVTTLSSSLVRLGLSVEEMAVVLPEAEILLQRNQMAEKVRAGPAVGKDAAGARAGVVLAGALRRDGRDRGRFRLWPPSVAVVSDGGDVAAGVGGGGEGRLAGVGAAKNVIAVGILGVAHLQGFLDQIADLGGVGGKLGGGSDAAGGLGGDFAGLLDDGLQAVQGVGGGGGGALELR